MNKNSAKTRWLPWLIFGLGAVFYTYEYYLRTAPSVMTEDLMSFYHTNALAFGNLAAFYYYAYVPMQLPVGILMDRYGPRRLLSLACFFCALGSYLFAMTASLWVAEIGRFMVGFGSAFAFVGVLKLATIWLPPERFAMIAGCTAALGAVGAIVGDATLTEMVAHQGWRQTINIVASIGMVLAVIMFLLIRDQNPSSQHYHFNNGIASEQPKTLDFGSVLDGFIAILRNPYMWINGIVGCLLYLPTTTFADLWGISYLEQARGFSNEEAAMAVIMLYTGWAIGAPLMGIFSDYIKQRKLPMIVSGIAAAILISILLYMPHISHMSIYTLLFFTGTMYSAQVITFAVGRELSLNKVSGIALAVTNMLCMLGGIVFQPVIGWLLDLHWDGRLVNGAEIYSESAYQFALAVLPIGLILAVILITLLPETRAKLKMHAVERDDALSEIDNEIVPAITQK